MTRAWGLRCTRCRRGGTTYGDLGKRWHRVVMDTRGMGDRRARKMVAREELRRRTGGRVYAVYDFGQRATGIVSRVAASITIKVWAS